MFCKVFRFKTGELAVRRLLADSGPHRLEFSLEDVEGRIWTVYDTSMDDEMICYRFELMTAKEARVVHTHMARQITSVVEPATRYLIERPSDRHLVTEMLAVLHGKAKIEKGCRGDVDVVVWFDGRNWTMYPLGDEEIVSGGMDFWACLIEIQKTAMMRGKQVARSAS